MGQRRALPLLLAALSLGAAEPPSETVDATCARIGRDVSQMLERLSEPLSAELMPKGGGLACAWLLDGAMQVRFEIRLMASPLAARSEVTTMLMDRSPATALTGVGEAAAWRVLLAGGMLEIKAERGRRLYGLGVVAADAGSVRLRGQAMALMALLVNNRLRE